MKKQKNVAHGFYKEALDQLHESGTDFMIGGAFALFHYTGIYRDTKDLDIFCKSSDYPKILKAFAEKGYRTELTDVRWLAKIFKDDHFIDLIFDTPNNICKVEEGWFTHAEEAQFLDRKVKILPAEELIWCKIYVQNRERYDGADVNHLILRYGKKIDWQRLLGHLDLHWHLLLSQIIMFQFIYPADYQSIIPKWLFNELIDRAKDQYNLPAPVTKVCRGPIIDQTQYSIDVKEWDYKVYTIKTV